MAKYKISLLTAVSDDNISTFIPTTLSQYESQVVLNPKTQTARRNDDQSFCYTYDEKYSQHQNAQKELTFKMTRKILMHDEWMTNPYIGSIHVGSLIELQDKYDNLTLFIVNKIAFEFQEQNIVYSYTCQDAFSYQYTRQQSGYTITNDATSEDFIGPKTIDWWVIKKIVPECYVKYNYVPIQVGLYRDSAGLLHRFTSADRALWDSTGVRTIIKEPFDDEEYQTTIVFSCSNSNANAALISLGDNLDLMLHTYEYHDINTNNYQEFFWYEPKQNSDITGLQYSPKSQIASFGLDFAGDSLTTVLNVSSNTVGDDLVTLLPSTPSLFTSYFMTDEWQKSTFYPGFFTDIINGKKYKYVFSADDDNNDLEADPVTEIKVYTDTYSNTEHNFAAIQLKDNTNVSYFTLPLLYNRFADNWDEATYSQWVYTIGSSAYNFSGRGNHLYLIISTKTVKEEETEGEATTYYIIHEDDELPAELLGTQRRVFLGMRTTKSEGTSVGITSIALYIQFYRNFTEEEQDFASAADQCPWLENRLIDFTYFLHQNIISRNEYETLMNKLQNNLRIINGRLLFLTDSYYQAVKTKIEILSDLTNKLDALAAAFEADVVTPLRQGQKPTNINSFISAYATTFSSNDSVRQILNYNEVIEDYFEKYASAEQRFLKNIYAFRQYFDQPCTFSYSQNAGVYQNTLAASIDSDYFIAFANPTFATWDGVTNAQLFYSKAGTLQRAPLITAATQTRYYKATVQEGSFTPVNTEEGRTADIYDFKSDNSYWLSQEEYETNFGSVSRDLDDITQYTNEDGTTYYQLSLTELKRLMIAENPSRYYLRNTDTYTLLDRVRTTCRPIFETLTWIALPNLLEYWDADRSSAYNKDYLDLCTWSNKQNSKNQFNTYSFFWDYYKSFFPISQIYYYGPVIRATSGLKTTEYNTQITEWTLSSINEQGQVDNTTTYQTYQAIPFAGNGILLKDWGPCTNDDGVAAKESRKQSWHYLGRKAYILNSIRNMSNRENAWEEGIEAFTSLEGKDKWLYQWNGWSNSKMPPEPTPSVDSKDDIKPYRYDSYFANYVVSSEADEQYRQRTAIWYDATGLAPDTDNEPAITWQQNYLKKIKYHIDTSSLSTAFDYKLYEYFNFYQYIVPSYSFRYHGKVSGEPLPLYVKNKYLRFLTPDSKINSNDTYIQIPVYVWAQTENSESLAKPQYNSVKRGYVDGQADKAIPEKTQFLYIQQPDAFTTDKVYSAITWYPLYDLGEDLSPKSVDVWSNVKSVTLNAYLQAKKLDNETVSTNIHDWPTVVSIQDNDGTYYGEYAYARVESYVRDVFDAAKQDTYCYLSNDYWLSDVKLGHVVSAVDTQSTQAVPQLTTVYSLEDDTAVSLLGLVGALKLTGVHLYVIPASDENMAPITTADDIEQTVCYRRIEQNDQATFERVYTLTQVANALTQDTDYCTKAIATKFKFIKNTSISLYNFTSTEQTFDLNLYLCHLKKTDDDTYEIESQLYAKPYTLDFSSTPEKHLTLLDNEGQSYSSTITYTQTLLESLINISNGTFWYRYHTRIDWPTLFEAAAAIETQLQIYWDQAYTASKYCKYFLPQYWQPMDGDTKNSFASDIIIEKLDANGNLTNVTLSNCYLPEVEIFNYDTQAGFKYKHYLPKYTWIYNPTSTIDIHSLVPNEQFLVTQNGSNVIRASDVPALAQNPGMNEIVNYLGTSLENWGVIENGYTVYYYRCGENTGTLWKDLAQDKLSLSTFEHLDGLYGMAYYLLRSSYQNRNLTEYESTKYQKQAIWNQIYTEYPFLMLEDNYSYSLATTSQQLMKMAQLVFKGKKEPERGYNIGLIDVHSLQGYVGQELKPGQGIAIAAQEYYDENDDIYNALAQYLFITDVSYSLRSDADISVTVNSVKYQEKVLQSLVKLIR